MLSMSPFKRSGGTSIVGPVDADALGVDSASSVFSSSSLFLSPGKGSSVTGGFGFSVSFPASSLAAGALAEMDSGGGADECSGTPEREGYW